MSSGLVLWAGTTRTASLEDRIGAAGGAGYTALSLSPHDYQQARASGRSDQDIRSLVADAGLQVAAFDPFTKWLPTWEPPAGFPEQVRAFLDVGEADFFRGATAVGASSITVFEPFGTRWPLDVLAESLAGVSRRARDAGLRVNLEFIPYRGIPDLAMAWQLLQLADVPETGLVFDTWHYFRGRPDDALLATIPGDRIGAVQVSDAAPTPVGELANDSLHHRLPAGDGSFPLQRVLDVLVSIGGLHDVGPEIFSDVFDQRSADVNAREALRGLDPWRAAC